MCAKSTCGCTYIYIYIHVRINACIHVCFCTCVYGYIYVRLYVCERTLWVHTDGVCAYTNTYMSVLASCLQMSFICVCRYMYICMYTWKTPWVDSDTLCAHRYTCTRICVWAWVCMCPHVYTYIWKDTVCVYEFTYVCVYTCIYARRLHMCVRKYLNVCMRV